MASIESLRPQDVALLVKLLCHPDRHWKQIELAQELGLSQSEVAKSKARLKKAKLIIGENASRQAALEFLIHGVKFAFPAEIGPITRGVPTAFSAPMHKNVVAAPEGVEGTFVWPLPRGEVFGQSLGCFYPGLPEAAVKDEKFYGMMAAIEMLRMGKARERSAAQKYIEQVIMG